MFFLEISSRFLLIADTFLLNCKKRVILDYKS